MILIFPLSHERTIVKRLPVITLFIIAVNVLLYCFTVYYGHPTTETLDEAVYSFAEYYYERPYLQAPEKVIEKLGPGFVEQLKVKQEETTEIPEEYLLNRQQEKLDDKIADFEVAFENEFYRKYGYIPSNGNLYTLFSSMFLHGGFLHLLFNMIFLYLSGYILEDYWGRILYPSFYLIGGVAATMAHAYMFPESNVPLVGASGAIAALMGAFLVRCFKTKIYFFYFMLIVIKIKAGRFLAPAYIMLPLWLLQQVVYALMTSESGGVAFWAHIGGFVFGVFFATLVKFLKIEEKLLTDAIDKKVNIYNSDEVNTKEKISTLKKIAEEEVDSGFVRSEKARLLLEEGNDKQALFECRRALVQFLKQSEEQEAIEYYREMSTVFSDLSLKYDYQIQLIELYEANREYKDAVKACKNLIHFCREIKEETLTITALIKYGDIFSIHLKNKKQAVKIWRQTLKVYRNSLSDEQKEILKTNINKVENPELMEKRKEPQITVAKTEFEHDAESQKQNKRVHNIFLFEDLPEELKYDIKVIEAKQVSRTIQGSNGLIFKGAVENTVKYSDINALCVYQVVGESYMTVDFFERGVLRPYRVTSDRISYKDFFDKPYSNVAQNFRHFVKLVTQNSKSVYSDSGTVDYIENKKINNFAGHTKVELYEKNFWAKLKDDMRYSCESCFSILWAEESRMETIKCPDCGQIMVAYQS